MNALRRATATNGGLTDLLTLPVAAMASVIGVTLVVLFSPALTAAVLIGMAQTDGLTGHLDRFLPGSAFKLLSVWALLLLVLTLRSSAMTRGRPRPSLPMAAAAVFALWLGVSHIVAVNPQAGIDHLKGFWSTLLLVPIVGLTIATARDLRIALMVLVVSGVISSICVILESAFDLRLTIIANPDDIAAWQGAIRSAGASAYNPTTAAQMLCASLMLSLGLAVWDASRRTWWLAAAAIMVIALPMMGARSALLAFGVGLVLLGWSARQSRHLPVIAVIALVGAAAAVPFLPSSIVERSAAVVELVSSDSTVDRTLLRRVSYNLIGLDLFARYPLTGVGPGGFPEIYASFDYRWFPGRELEPRQLHNAYLEVLAETGLPGLVLFLTATFGAVGLAWQASAATGANASLARATALALATFLFASLFMPNEDNKFTWILMALACRAAWIARRDPEC